MDFGLLPPEVNSARIYAGPGPGPMMAAAAAWDGLADELGAAASSYAATTSGLTAGPWLGPASTSMAAAAHTWVAWLNTVAEQAEQTAIQAKAAAAAYEAALAATVPPPVIAANRALLQVQVATNFFGLNSAAIAVTESDYAEMWAQDATAMYTYAGMSAAAATLTPFAPPPQTTNSAGMGDQATAASAVAHATATSATSTQATLSQLTSAVPAALHGLSTASSPTAAPSATGLLTGLQNLGLVSPSTVIEPASVGLGASELSTASGAWASASDGDTAILSLAHNIHADLGAFSGRMVGMEHRILGHLKTLGAIPSGSPGLGHAVSVGALSVPPAWATAAPTIKLVTATLPSVGGNAAPAVLSGFPGTSMGEMSLASTVGSLVGGGAKAGGRERTKMTAAVHLVSPSTDTPAVAVEMQELVGLLRELGALRDGGIHDGDLN